MDLCLASLAEKKVKFGGIAVALPAQTIFSWATFLNGREMNLNFVSVLLNVELLELVWEVEGGRGGSLWPIRGNIRDSHIMFRAQSTPSPYCCHLKVFYCWCKNRPKSSLSQKKRGTSWTLFLQDMLHFSISFFHFWQAAKPVIDICFDWQKYQNIKPSSFNNQAVSYVFGTVCKRIVQSLFRSKERKNKLNDRNKLLWGSDAYPIIQSKVLTKDETEEKKE